MTATTKPATDAVDVLEEPTVSDAGADAFDDTPPDVEVGTVPPPSGRDVEKTVAGLLRSLDRVLSFVLRCDRCTDEEFEEFVNMIAPAAKQHGGRLGPRFYAIVAGIGVAGFVVGKVLAARPAHEPTVDTVATETDAPAGGRFNREPIYPRDGR